MLGETVRFTLLRVEAVSSPYVKEQHRRKTPLLPCAWYCVLYDENSSSMFRDVSGPPPVVPGAHSQTSRRSTSKIGRPSTSFSSLCCLSMAASSPDPADKIYEAEFAASPERLEA